jgi:hypothetical protein
MADITVLQGVVGPASAGVGESRAVSLARNTGLRTASAQATLQDAVERGYVFAVCNQAGVTSQAGLSATTPVLTLANPASSGKNLVLWYAGANMLVANAAAAAVFLAAGTDTAAAAVTGTLTTAHRNLKLGAANNPAARTFLAATLPAAPVAIAILGAGLTGAITTVPSVQSIERWFNGSVILKPGTNISIQTSTASGASGLLCEFIWEEVDE